MAGLMAMAKQQKMKLLMIAISAVLSGLAIIAQGYLFVLIVDQIFLKGSSVSDILPYLLWLIVALFARTLFNYLSGRTGIMMATKVKSDLRNALLNKFSRNPMQASLQGQSGRKVSVIMDAVDEVDSYFSDYIPQMIQSLIIPIMLLIVIFMEHAATGFIFIFTAPFIPIFMMIIGFNTKDKAEEQLEKMAAFSGKFLDTLQGLTTLKLFGRSVDQKEEIGKSSIQFREATMVVLKTAFSNSLALEFISMLSIGLIALEVAIRLIIFQDITFFTGFLMLVLAPELLNKLKELGNAFHTGRGSMGAAKKLEQELEDTKAQIEFGEENLSKEEPPLIELEAVSFNYGENAFALKNITAKILPNQEIAIVGKTGAGKTTLLHLIAGLVPLSEGKVIVNKKERSSYSERSWFDQLIYISQDPYLFSGTFAENIAIGKSTDTTREEIEQAADKAGLRELVDSLDQGFDTLIGEGGRGLSGGEKQRVALARAFLKRPSIILFDEPTTGLDLVTERILQTSMMELSKNSTVITVAHRLHTIQNADQILFLDKGELISIGKHEELLNSVGAYREMITVQQGGAAQ
ncbi:thiol reductant ABC exporter subunit CydD [Oceanobacillus sp. CAU 1775]